MLFKKNVDKANIYLLLRRDPNIIKLSSIKATVSDVVSPRKKHLTILKLETFSYLQVYKN